MFAGTVDHLSGRKPVLVPDRKPSRRHNLGLVQNGKRLVRAGGNRWHLAAIHWDAGDDGHGLPCLQCVMFRTAETIGRSPQ
jgi:hypothetical protein